VHPRPWLLLAIAGLGACALTPARSGRTHPTIGSEDLRLCEADTELAPPDWLARGCPRVALERIDPTDASAPLHAARARAAVVADGLDETAPPGMLLDLELPRWAWAHHPAPPRERFSFGRGASVDDPGAGVVLQALEHDVRRVAALHASDPARASKAELRSLALRSFVSVRCLDTVMAAQLVALSAEGSRMRHRLVGELGLIAPSGPDELRIESMAAAWACELDEAHRLAIAAVEGHARAGDPDAAFAAALDAIELEVFPGGRADSFAVASFTPADSEQWAALSEAAMVGAGDLSIRAQRLTQRLTELDAALPISERAPAVRARVELLRAVAALRLQGRVEPAIEHAETALTLARSSARADRADFARVILVLAHAERGALDHANAILAALERSFARRGAEGARNRVARILREAATLEVDRGRSELGVELARLGRRLRPELSSFTERGATLTALPNVLLAAGRIEEAVEEIDRGRTVWAADRKRVDPRAWALVDAQLEQTGVQLRARLGDPGDLDPAVAFGELGLGDGWASAQRGDTATLRRELAALAVDRKTAMLAAAPALGLCHALDDELAELGELLAGATEQLELALATGQTMADPAARAELRTTALDIERTVIPQLAACFAVTRHPERVRPLRALADRLRGIGRLGALGELEGRIHDAYLAEANGRFAEAAELYLALARALASGPGLASGTAIGLGETAAPMYERAVFSALADHDGARAIAILEEARARDLRVRLAARTGQGSPLAEVAALERSLAEQQTRLRRLAQLVEHAPDADTRAALTRRHGELLARVEQLRAGRDAAVRETSTRASAAYHTAALAPAAELVDIRAELEHDEVLVYYVTANEQAHAIVVDRGSTRVVALPAVDAKTGAPRLAGALRELLITVTNEAGRGAHYRRDTDAPAPRDPASLRASLHAMLVAPLHEHIAAGKRVIVVPDANTVDLPWAALGPSDAPWIARNPLRVLPGGYLMLGRRDRSASHRQLVIGDPDFAGAGGSANQRGGASEVAWQRLPGTRIEADRVAALYRTRALTDVHATEAGLRRHAGKAEMIHIASHGVADTSRPAYSAIVLADPRRGEGDDGLLHAYEIERLRLDAELVVLSACETGLGQRRGQEGLLALDRAFLIAGARAVISSLWLVDDDATAALLTAFHRARRAGERDDVALQHAMNQVRALPKWRDPHYWSAFRLVGAGSRRAATATRKLQQ
jgi:CHAT domain-containing protein